MNTPRPVPGTDRAAIPDAGRQTPGRSANGRERFGAALSAELGSRSAQDDRSPESRTTTDRAVQDRVARDRTALHHPAQDRVGRHRAAEDESASDRTAAAPSGDHARPARRTAVEDERTTDAASIQAGTVTSVLAAGVQPATEGGDTATAVELAPQTATLPGGRVTGAGTSGGPSMPPVDSSATHAVHPEADTSAPAVGAAPSQGGSPGGATNPAPDQPGNAVPPESRTSNATAAPGPTGNPVVVAHRAQDTAGEALPAADATHRSGPTTDSTGTAPDTTASGSPASPGKDSARPADSATANRPSEDTPSAGPDNGTTGVPAPPVDPATAPRAPDAAPGVPDQALAGVTGPAPTGPARAAAAPPPAPGAAPSAPPAPPAAQVAMQIVPLRLEADGVHRLTVHLHPVDLGPVQVVAEIRNGDVTVQLSGSTDAGTAALRESLDDLRRELTASGFGNCSLDLQQGGEQARQQYPRSHPVLTGSTGNGPPATPEKAPAAAARSGRLDVNA